jgi:hypothetical protein
MAKKVAREIKYFSPNTDYDALTSELSSEKDFQDSSLDGVQGGLANSELEEYVEWVKQTASECSTGKKTGQGE